MMKICPITRVALLPLLSCYPSCPYITLLAMLPCCPSCPVAHVNLVTLLPILTLFHYCSFHPVTLLPCFPCCLIAHVGLLPMLPSGPCCPYCPVALLPMLPMLPMLPCCPCCPCCPFVLLPCCPFCLCCLCFSVTVVAYVVGFAQLCGRDASALIRETGKRQLNLITLFLKKVITI